MPNIHDYMDWRGDILFSQNGFCDVDNLVLSCLCFLNFEGIVPFEHNEYVTLLEAADKFFENDEKIKENYGYIIPGDDFKKLFLSTAHSKRFGSLLLSGFINRVDYEGVEQFSATTFTFENGDVYIAFRGTDDNIVAWKEDFFLSYNYPIKAQKSALEYLAQIAQNCEGKIYIGGHSKGGNLAVYSAVNAEKELSLRIEKVWSNDGPGFYKRIVESEEYASVKEKIHVILPEDSIIGRLFDNSPEKQSIVKATTKGLLQHNPFTWQVLGNDFIHAERFTDDSTVVRRAFRKYLSEIDAKGRENFVSAFFSLLGMTGAKTLSELARDGFAAIPATLKTLGGFEKEEREMLLSFIGFMLNLPVK